MNISTLDMVNRNADARKAYLHQLSILGSLTVAIDGVRQDDTIVELVKPVIAGELRARVRQIEADLASMGVTVD